MNCYRTQTILMITGVAIIVALLIPKLSAIPLLGENEGYEPQQPIAYSHLLHAGELKIDCQYCHYGASDSRHAGVPPLDVCMNCHKFITAPLGKIRAEMALAKKEKRAPQRIVSPEIQKIYDALGLDERMAKDLKKAAKPMSWVKVYDLPDYVRFDHRRHVNVGVDCQDCHGQVETMERVRQVGTLSMGWCVNCHRDNTGKVLKGQRMLPSNDCISCHY
jgi:hypothetical protein